MRARLLLVCLAAMAAGTPAADARAPARLLVVAQEWSLTLSRGSVPSGTVIVQLYDRGQDAHDINIRRLGAHGQMSGPTQYVAPTPSGSLSQATWHLSRGRYELYCSLPGHAEKGMRAYLTVR